MWLLALLAGWTIGAPPPGHELVLARQYEARQVTFYARTRRDPFDAPVTLEAFDAGRSPYAAPPAPHTTVHGQPAEYAPLVDDGRTYGRALRWVEPSGVTLLLSVVGRPGDARLRAVAESVRAETPERWQALLVATSFPPDTSDLPGAMKRVVVRRERGAKLTALLPRGFPVAPEDRRAACYRLTYRGQRSYGNGCDHPASWRRIGGTVFVFGTVEPRVRRVRVEGEGVDVTVRTWRARGYPLARFYVARLPATACFVDVRDARRGTVISPTGPVPGGSRADRRRCR